VITDGLLNFVGPNYPLSLVIGAGLAARSNIIDLLGIGVGMNPASQSIIGNRTLWGTDFGIDMLKAQIQCAVGTAFVTANGATLNVQFQAAPDSGVAGGFQPGAWTTLVETGPIAAANLTAAAIIARFDYPPAVPVSFQPRFISLNFATPTGANFSAGSIANALVTMARDDYSAAYAAKNFSVA
jgi:hypothetical protein